jgi:hypothetical protein
MNYHIILLITSVLDPALLEEKYIIESEPERSRVGCICVCLSSVKKSCVHSPQAAIFMIGFVIWKFA